MEPAAWAEAILSLARDPARREAMLARARDTAARLSREARAGWLGDVPETTRGRA